MGTGRKLGAHFSLVWAVELPIGNSISHMLLRKSLGFQHSFRHKRSMPFHVLEKKDVGEKAIQSSPSQFSIDAFHNEVKCLIEKYGKPSTRWPSNDELNQLGWWIGQAAKHLDIKKVHAGRLHEVIERITTRLKSVGLQGLLDALFDRAKEVPIGPYVKCRHRIDSLAKSSEQRSNWERLVELIAVNNWPAPLPKENDLTALKPLIMELFATDPLIRQVQAAHKGATGETGMMLLALQRNHLLWHRCFRVTEPLLAFLLKIQNPKWDMWLRQLIYTDLPTAKEAKREIARLHKSKRNAKYRNTKVKQA